MRNLYGPVIMRRIFDAATAVGLQTVDEIDMDERNALEVYIEYNTATTLKIVPWVRLKGYVDDNEKADIWAALPEVTIAKVTDSAHPAGPTVLGGSATRSTVVVISVPNCYAMKLELSTLASGDVTIWAAPIEKPPAIS